MWTPCVRCWTSCAVVHQDDLNIVPTLEQSIHTVLHICRRVVTGYSEGNTRITEFKHLTGQELPGVTTIVKEFSRPYTGDPRETPYYAIINPENNALYAKYKAECRGSETRLAAASQTGSPGCGRADGHSTG